MHTCIIDDLARNLNTNIKSTWTKEYRKKFGLIKHFLSSQPSYFIVNNKQVLLLNSVTPTPSNDVTVKGKEEDEEEMSKAISASLNNLNINGDKKNNDNDNNIINDGGM